jgi:hypothetical protein
VKDESLLSLAVSFEGLPDDDPASGAELELIASFLPELLREMLAQSEVEGE